MDFIQIRIILCCIMQFHVCFTQSTGDMPFMPVMVTMQTLKNASAMICTDAMGMPLARMVQLRDVQLRSMFEDKGGNYVRDYMAATQEEAAENFPNMVFVTVPISVPGANTTFNIMDNMMAKQIIMDDLRKLELYLKKNLSGQFTTKSIVTPGTNDYTTTKTATSGGKSPTLTDSTTPSRYPTPTPTLMSLDKATTNNSPDYVTPLPQITPSTDKYPVPVTYATPPIKGPLASSVPRPNKPTMTTINDTDTHASSTMASEPHMTTSLLKTILSSTAPTTTVTLDPEVANGLDQLRQFANGSLFNGSQVGTRDLSEIWREANTTIDPAVLLGLKSGGNRKKRNTDGSQSRVEYCHDRGSLTEDKRFMHMCTICAATTQLADDYFPRFINEAVCKTGDSDCLVVGPTAHGQCKQTRFSLNMMRKKKGYCQMMVHGGDTLVFEDWELAHVMIKVACECTINKLSQFSAYVGHNRQSIPIG